MSTPNVAELQTQPKKKLLTRIAERFGVDEGKLMETLKATAFKQRDGSVPSNEQMMALLVVAEQYHLNPFTKEIYAFPDKANGIVPVVGVDGWSRIINSHPQYAGMEFVYSDEMVQMPGAKVKGHVWIECVMYRKDIDRPIRIREYLDEVYREPFQKNGYQKDGPWQTHTKRFHRHKTMIQCARMAFGFTGIFDQDEAERMQEIDITSQGSHSMSGNAQAQPDQPAPKALTHEQQQEMEPVLHALAQRAVNSGAWAAAHQWVEQRYAGAQLEHATRYLREAEIDTMPSEVPGASQDRAASSDTSQPEQAEAPQASEPTESEEPEASIAEGEPQRQAVASADKEPFPRPEDQFPSDDDGGFGF